MATIKDLATRTLQQLRVLAAGETPSAEDEELVTQKLMSVHSFLREARLLRWTSQAIPDYAEESYVMMASFLAAGPFGKAADPAAWQNGLTTIQMAVSRPVGGTVRAEYF